MMRAKWITWESQIRNRSLSERLGADLYEILAPFSGWRRYMHCISQTFPLLRASKDETVVVQNPSMALAIQAVICRPLLGYRLIVDAHNAGINPREGRSCMLNAVTRFIVRFTDFTIVSNAALAKKVKELGGTSLVIPDPLPKMPDACDLSGRAKSTVGRNEPVVVFICTWAADEPYLEVIEAAGSLPHVRFFITGNSRGREREYQKAWPANVQITGYLPQRDYEALIASADILLDLTTRDDCLVCGAYEAVALAKPYVVSDTAALRGYFRAGGYHVRNDSNSIAEGLSEVLSRIDLYRREVIQFRATLEEEWRENFSRALEKLAI